MGHVKCTRKVQYIYMQTHLDVQTQRMTGDTRLFHDAVDNCLNETNGGNNMASGRGDCSASFPIVGGTRQTPRVL